MEAGGARGLPSSPSAERLESFKRPEDAPERIETSPGRHRAGPSKVAIGISEFEFETLNEAGLRRDSPINLVETVAQYNIITGVGFGGGSICFHLGAALLLARQVRPCILEWGSPIF